MSTQYIEVRGKKHKVEPVSKIYFRGLTECLGDLADVDLLSKSAKTIKKVLVPTITDDIIVKSNEDENFYLWHPSVEPEEISDLILGCGRCYRLQKLEEAKAKGDEAAIAEQEEGLRIINEYLRMPLLPSDENETEGSASTSVLDVQATQVPDTESEGEVEKLKAEIARLKQQQGVSNT
ncbi:hypothetical protein WA1_19030 [Scytonema hofmannii PCC 7110]|uniref:Uncharacterized protein n=1 Tax=Scytonema hofmannii PCC 7110 TaxID=128403 RepID=A0A139XBN2_9CYAN|nr:hypothetical protein [Scytonema hofmannii]KYC42095.1 hypothetical protein WA1_19030 [Scytonema hofmannii PCC 7110]